MSDLDNFNKYIDSSELSTLDDLLIILPKNESSNGEIAALQSTFFPSTQDHDLSFFIEPNTEPTELTWNNENMQPTVMAWQQSDLLATTIVTSQQSATQPKAGPALQASDRQPATVHEPNLTYSSDEFLGGAQPPMNNTGSHVGNLPLTLESLLCGICGDRATGKHYGAISCDGCKGFFRRSVRKNQEYACRFNCNCIVTKEKRNQCRFCRLRKCFRSGMKKTAVQNERDKINYRRSSQKQDKKISNEQMINHLLRTEEQNQTLEPIVADEQVASIEDVCSSMKNELRRFVEWANKFPEFLGLSVQDRLALLKGRGAEHLILGVAKRSFNRRDSLLLANRSVILKDITNTDSVQSEDSQMQVRKKIANISSRIFRELIQPWKSINMDDFEFACLKSIAFFNPNAKGLVDTNRVEEFRDQMQLNLENYMSDRQYEGRGRLGKLLLTLLSLQSISKEMADDMMYAELFCGLQMDHMFQEIF